MFDFKKFCNDYNIEIPDETKNTNIGWINVNCPFCISGDYSNHLGFNITNDYMNCWKCGHHSLYEYVQTITKENPISIIKKYNADNIIQKKLNQKIIKNNKIILPGNKLLNIHKKYLLKRNFDPDYLQTKYNIKGSSNLGEYKFRIIIPIYYQSKVVSFQTRDITGKQKLKYVSCPKEKEIIHHKKLLYNIDNCKEKFIIIVEGVFDVWRLGDNSACTFGTGYSIAQVKQLKNYKKVYIIFDNEIDAQKKAKRLALQLDNIGIKAFNILLDNENDPAELSENSTRKLLQNIVLYNKRHPDF